MVYWEGKYDHDHNVASAGLQEARAVLEQLALRLRSLNARQGNKMEKRLYPSCGSAVWRR